MTLWEQASRIDTPSQCPDWLFSCPEREASSAIGSYHLVLLDTKQVVIIWLFGDPKGNPWPTTHREVPNVWYRDFHLKICLLGAALSTYAGLFHLNSLFLNFTFNILPIPYFLVAYLYTVVLVDFLSEFPCFFHIPITLSIQLMSLSTFPLKVERPESYCILSNQRSHESDSTHNNSPLWAMRLKGQM